MQNVEAKKTDGLKHSFIILLLLNVALLHHYTLHAQSKYSVANAETGEPIPYATIKILHTARGTFTDERGEFQLAFHYMTVY